MTRHRRSLVGSPLGAGGRLLGAAVVLLLASGCSGEPQDEGPAPDATAAALATALTDGDLADLTFTDLTAAEATADYTAVVEGLGDVAPQVEVAGVEEAEAAPDGEAEAVATLTWTWPIGTEDWTYDAPVTLSRTGDGQGWAVDWGHAVVEPRLSDAAVLELSVQEAPRGDVLGARGQVLVADRPVTRVGIDKSAVGAGAARRSASALARLTDIDPGPYRRAVAAAGDAAYVEAITYRDGEVPAAVRSGYRALDGVLLLSEERALAPSRTFAAPILGTVGEVTAEMVADDPARYEPGDVAGLSGLQARYDDQLRGSPGAVVSAVASDGRTRELTSSAPEPGQDLRLSLDLRQQQLAERVLVDVEGGSALVAVRPSTGEVLAAANGPGNDGQNLATFGQYAPGSTFKTVTSLALLRSELAPETPVSCPATITVDGRVFGNYSDYPAGGTGTIPLRTAVANSCNTAFISSRDRLDDDALAAAAASLGLGVDHEVGFPAYFGEVPPATTETGRAADTIGQGTVLASPMAMATVIASVQEGSTVVPWLVEGETSPVPAGTDPLARREAEQLRGMLRGVVTQGSGRVLADVPGGPVIAKTGTAEYAAADGSTRTHAWMIAARGDLAVAAFVADGASGSATAGPLLARYLAEAP